MGVFRQRSFIAITVAVVLPLLWTAIEQIRSGWWPVNDDALMGLSARDVLTGHPPVMGPRTTTSFETGIETHHPGPIGAYLLSLPSALFGFGPGALVFACALWSAITCAAILLVAHRLGGTTYAVGAALAIAAVWWALGVQISVRPFNPYFGVLPVLLLALLAWGLLRRDLALMPWFAITASVLIQSHLSYALFVPVVALPVVVAGLVRWSRARSTIWPLRGWAGPKVAWWRRRGWWTTVAVLVIWVPPVIELCTYHPNNLTQVIRFLRSDSRTSSFGLSRAVEVVLHMLLPAPGGYRSQQVTGIAAGSLPTGLDVRSTFGVAVVLLLAAVAWRIPRWALAPRGRTLQVGARVALTWLVGSVLVVASLPRGQGNEGWNYLQLWPSVALAWLVTALVVGALTRTAKEWVPARALPAARRFVRFTRSYAARRAAVASGVLALLLVVVVPLASPVDAPRVRGAQYTAVVDRLCTELAGTSRPVAISAVTAGAGFEVAPALGYGLSRRGKRIYLPSLWHGAEDTDFRKLSLAPASSVRVVVEELPHGRITALSATADGTLMGLIESTSGEHYAVYARV